MALIEPLDAVGRGFVPEWNRTLSASRHIHEHRLSYQRLAHGFESNERERLSIGRPGGVDARALTAWRRKHAERQELRGQSAHRNRALVRAVGIGDEKRRRAVEPGADEGELPAIGRPADRAVDVVEDSPRAAAQERHTPERRRARLAADEIHEASIRRHRGCLKNYIGLRSHELDVAIGAELPYPKAADHAVATHIHDEFPVGRHRRPPRVSGCGDLRDLRVLQ